MPSREPNGTAKGARIVNSSRNLFACMKIELNWVVNISGVCGTMKWKEIVREGLNYSRDFSWGYWPGQTVEYYAMEMLRGLMRAEALKGLLTAGISDRGKRGSGRGCQVSIYVRSLMAAFKNSGSQEFLRFLNVNPWEVWKIPPCPCGFNKFREIWYFQQNVRYVVNFCRQTFKWNEINLQSIAGISNGNNVTPLQVTPIDSKITQDSSKIFSRNSGNL